MLKASLELTSLFPTYAKPNLKTIVSDCETTFAISIHTLIQNIDKNTLVRIHRCKGLECLLSGFKHWWHVARRMIASKSTLHLTVCWSPTYNVTNNESLLTSDYNIPHRNMLLDRSSKWCVAGQLEFSSFRNDCLVTRCWIIGISGWRTGVNNEDAATARQQRNMMEGASGELFIVCFRLKSCVGGTASTQVASSVCRLRVLFCEYWKISSCKQKHLHFCQWLLHHNETLTASLYRTKYNLTSMKLLNWGAHTAKNHMIMPVQSERVACGLSCAPEAEEPLQRNLIPAIFAWFLC